MTGPLGNPSRLDLLLGRKKVFIGMVHLLPLPGSSRWRLDMAAILQHAQQDALTLQEGGVDALMVENYGDAPYNRGRVEASTVAAMTRAVDAVKSRVDLPIGINVLRNDPRAALGIATATGADFIRANVHFGVMAAGEGILEGDASETLRDRRYLGTEVKIMADVLVKHAAPIGPEDIALMAYDTVHRGLADALIVTGPATGSTTDLEDVRKVKNALPKTPVLVGSGVTEANAGVLMSVADGAIVGTSLKVDGRVENAVDLERVRALARHFGDAR